MRRRDIPIALAGLGLSAYSKALGSAAEPAKLALLIGINRYRSSQLDRLKGCKNDIEGMRSALIGSYGFLDKDILMLTDKKATYEGIVNAFKNHLLKAPTGAIVVFQFSGHGSRYLSAKTASGYSETIVPYDSRDPKNLDITSEALSSMFRELGKRTKNITVILDSCNSGRMVSVVRKSVSDHADKVLVRQIEPAQDPPPNPPFAPAARRSIASGTGALEPLDDSYVLMAAVLPSQLAKEYKSGNRSYGAMTYFLLREIASPQPRATYRNIMDVVK
jgi:uncharacterized caspase-like protein